MNQTSSGSSTSSSVFQSGETVSTAGHYEAVGVDLKEASNKQEAAAVDLNKGELFPNYQGRAVSWRLVQPASKG